MTQPVDRLQGSLEQILALLIPRLRSELAAFLPWEYRVTLATVTAPGLPIIVACLPVDIRNCPFGPLTIPVGKGPAGSPCVPVIGSTCVVKFLDGNPAKPIIDGFGPKTPTVPPAPAYVPPLPLTLAGALTTFATTLSSSDPPAAPACAQLITALSFLL